MKRAAIITRQVSKTTGAARNTLEQVNYLIGKGYRVDVIGEYVNKSLVRKNSAAAFQYRGWPLKGYWRRRLFAWRAERKIANEQYDLVFGHGDIINQDVLFLHNCVHLAHELIHSSVISEKDIMGRLHGSLLTQQKFRLLVANSNLMAEDVVKRFCIPEEKVEVIYPGYASEQFNLLNHDLYRKKIRHELNISEDVTLVGLITSGNFKKRNVSLFIDSVSQLPKNIINKCFFIVVGKTKISEKEKYIIQINSSNLKNNFKILPPTSDIKEFYHALDVQVLPAIWEEFGRVVLESMACGLPVVVSDKVGASEILPQVNKEFVFNVDNKRALTQHLVTLINAPERRKIIGDINSSEALNYSAQNQAEKLDHLLKEHSII